MWIEHLTLVEERRKSGAKKVCGTWLVSLVSNLITMHCSVLPLLLIVERELINSIPDFSREEQTPYRRREILLVRGA